MDGFPPFGFAHGTGRALRGQAPVGRFGGASLAIHAQAGGRRQLADAGEHRARCRHHRVQGEMVMQRDRV